MKRTWICAALLMAAGLSLGCMAKKDRIEMGPFFFKRDLPEEKETEGAFLWPLFQYRSGSHFHQYSLRPLLNIRRETSVPEAEALLEIQALWPLFLHKQTDGLTRRRTRLYPVFHSTRFQHADGQEEVDIALYPFFFAGRSNREGDYAAFFPLMGRINGLFGKEWIRFFLFPLYADTRDGEYRSWHVLWPLLHVSKGGKKSSIRLWPLIGWKEKENRYKKFYLVWPLFARIQLGLGSDHPTDSWFFLPFYGRQQTPFGKIQYFLWPFFSYQQNERPGNRLREWQGPFPFLSIARGDKYRRTSLWPFWGRKESSGYCTEFIAYPLYRFESYESNRVVSKQRYVLPFYWSRTFIDLKTGSTRKRIKLWPFFDFSKGAQGGTRLRIFSPLWFRDPEGFERNYSDFWTLYASQRHPTGAETKRLLWFIWHRGALDQKEELEMETKGFEALTVPDRSVEDIGDSKGFQRDGLWFRRWLKKARAHSKEIW